MTKEEVLKKLKQGMEVSEKCEASAKKEMREKDAAYYVGHLVIYKEAIELVELIGQDDDGFGSF